MEASKKIREYIESNLVVFDEDATFSDNDNIFALGFVNSLFAMKLLNFIENEFNIKVDNENIVISNFSSINNMMKLIEKQKGAMST